MKKNYYIFLLAVIILVGCRIPAYYMSPFNSTTNYYHAIPMQSDSIKTATYATGLFTAGGSNYFWRDGVSAFNGSLHQSRNFGKFQAFYGANLTLGNYHVKEYYGTNAELFRTAPIDTLIHIAGGNNFFGSCGFNGGINYVIPSKNGKFEWRIGLETSIQHEFGAYLSFRKSLPDTAVDIVEKSNWTKTLGGYFDFNWKSRTGIIVGYKVALDGVLVSHATYVGNQSQFAPAYFSQTIHITKNPVTYFTQLNIGSYAANVQFGVNFMLGKH